MPGAAGAVRWERRGDSGANGAGLEPKTAIKSTTDGLFVCLFVCLTVCLFVWVLSLFPHVLMLLICFVGFDCCLFYCLLLRLAIRSDEN